MKLRLPWCLLFAVTFTVLHLSRCEKLPPWFGPDSFYGGTVPSNRSGHRITSGDDGKIYVFGGQNKDTGEWNCMG